MCNKNICLLVKLAGLFACIFLIIALIIFISCNNPIKENKNILVTVARPRR